MQDLGGNLLNNHGWFLKRFDRTKALGFLNMVEAMRPLTITPDGSHEQKAAAELLRKFSDQDLTLADAVGLLIMKNVPEMPRSSSRSSTSWR